MLEFQYILQIPARQDFFPAEASIREVIRIRTSLHCPEESSIPPEKKKAKKHGTGVGHDAAMPFSDPSTPVFAFL